jgi:glutamyl-tRNA reductase
VFRLSRTFPLRNMSQSSKSDFVETIKNYEPGTASIHPSSSSAFPVSLTHFLVFSTLFHLSLRFFDFSIPRDSLHSVDSLENYELQQINKIKERKGHHIRCLMKSHNNSFKVMKNFYNRTTQSYLSMMRRKEYEQCKKGYQKEINELSRKLAEKKAENGK